MPKREDEAELYPQKSRAIPSITFDKIAARYSSEIHGILDNLSLSEKELDRLVLPLIGKLIRLVHLLPASESHHHSGQGGLLSHPKLPPLVSI
jgi:conjugal transfer pilus assembly protein TraI